MHFIVHLFAAYTAAGAVSVAILAAVAWYEAHTGQC